MRINLNNGGWNPDVVTDLGEMFGLKGRLIRFDTPIISIPSVNNYLVIVFTAPPPSLYIRDGIILNSPEVIKSGDDLQVELIQDPTISAGGTAFSFVNMRHSSVNVDPLLDKRYGLSSALTISGGTTKYLHFIPGTDTSQNSQPNSSTPGDAIGLNPGSKYAVKITNLTGATKVHCSLVIGQLVYGEL